MVALARAISTPAIIALRKPFTCTPGIKYADMKTAAPNNKISTISFILYKINLSTLFLICLFGIAVPGCGPSVPTSTGLKAIKFELNKDSSKIVLKGLEYQIFQSLKADTLSSEDWENLFAVYARPSGAGEIVSHPVHGTYSVTDSSIIFSPDTSFTTGHTYDAVFSYPQYYSKGDALSKKTLPGKIATVEAQFAF